MTNSCFDRVWHIHLIPLPGIFRVAFLWEFFQIPVADNDQFSTINFRFRFPTALILSDPRLLLMRVWLHIHPWNTWRFASTVYVSIIRLCHHPTTGMSCLSLLFFFYHQKTCFPLLTHSWCLQFHLANAFFEKHFGWLFCFAFKEHLHRAAETSTGYSG